MKTILNDFVGKTLRVYTISGVDSYLGILQEVMTDYIVLKSFFKEDKTYVATQHIESFKVEKEEG